MRKLAWMGSEVPAGLKFYVVLYLHSATLPCRTLTLTWFGWACDGKEALWLRALLPKVQTRDWAHVTCAWNSSHHVSFINRSWCRWADSSEAVSRALIGWVQVDRAGELMLRGWKAHFTILVVCRVLLFVTLWTVSSQSLLSMGFSRQEY